MEISFQCRGKGHWSAFSPLYAVRLAPVFHSSSGGATYELTLYRRYGRTPEPMAPRRVAGLRGARAEAEAMLRAAERPPETDIPGGKVNDFVDYDEPGVEERTETRIRAFAKRWRLREVSRHQRSDRLRDRRLLVIRVTFAPLGAAPASGREAASC